MEPRVKKALDFLTRNARRVEANRSIPEDRKKVYLNVNRSLRDELRGYDEAQKVLKAPYRRPGDLSARVRAREQIKHTEALARSLRLLMETTGEDSKRR